MLLTRSASHKIAPASRHCRWIAEQNDVKLLKFMPRPSSGTPWQPTSHNGSISARLSISPAAIASAIRLLEHRDAVSAFGDMVETRTSNAKNALNEKGDLVAGAEVYSRAHTRSGGFSVGFDRLRKGRLAA